MKASIIIPTKNGGERFSHVLKALFENELADEFEVIVIDSGSSDNTLQTAASYPVRLHRIAPQEFDHGKVRNLGARISHGDFLVFLTQDAIPADRHWLAALLQPFAGNNAIAGVYSRQIPDGDNPMENFFLQRIYGDRRIVRRCSSSFASGLPPLQDIFFSNVGSAIRRKVWEQIPFREGIVMSEDQEWSKRALFAGYETVYEPGAAVYHAHNYSARTVFLRNRDSGFSLHNITKERFLPSLASAVSFVAAEIAALYRSHGCMIIPRVLLYETSRFGGFAFGSAAARFRRKPNAER
ncbi:MAG: glycosyltransferase [Nitrospiraceae bacterium]|nr:glycosyltransferase [Nitrospiraceae bacterium]